ALAVLVPLLWSTLHSAPGQVSQSMRLANAAVLAVMSCVAALLAWGVSPVPWSVIAFGRYAATTAGSLAPEITTEAAVSGGADNPKIFCTYLGEGINVSVAVTQNREGFRSFHAAGKVQASTLPSDMRVQRMLGHIPSLLHTKPKSVLVVACG